MNLLFWGMTLSVIGKGLLALAIIWVHVTMATERSIDEEVVRAFRRETVLTLLGIFLIVIGYVFEVIALGGFPALFSCSGAECAAMIGAAVR